MALPLKTHRPGDVLSRGEHKGFKWIVMHDGLGYRCGYVNVPATHPWAISEDDRDDVFVHGGITYSSSDNMDDSYWVGFHCAHFNDGVDLELCFSDSAKYIYNRSKDIFTGPVRDQEYVENECKSLCEQAAEATKM